MTQGPGEMTADARQEVAMPLGHSPRAASNAFRIQCVTSARNATSCTNRR